jgi:hypothetical protein
MGFLRDIFGPSKADIWQQLADEANGCFVDGGFLGKSKVVFTHGQWSITLDTYTRDSSTFTRMRVPYVNQDGFRFDIFFENLVSGIGKSLGAQDIQSGDAYFDDRFVIKGNSEQKVRDFLANPRLRELIEAQPSIRFEVRDDEGWFGSTFPDGVDELRFTCSDFIYDTDRLKALYELFAVALDQLCYIGSAYEDDPHVDLK